MLKKDPNNKQSTDQAIQAQKRNKIQKLSCTSWDVWDARLRRLFSKFPTSGK